MFITLNSFPANAHIGAPEGRAPIVVDGALVGAGTTWGVVKREGDQWLRVCEEAVGDAVHFYQGFADGRVLVGTGSGLVVTSDNGCSYQSASPLLDGKLVGALARSLDTPSLLYVATSNNTGTNAVYRSGDSGQTFTQTGLEREGITFASLATTPDGQTLFVGGLRLLTDPRQPVLFVSTDGGTNFAEVPITTSAFTFLTLVGLDRDTGEAFVTTLSSEAGATGSVLWRATSAGLTQVASLDGVVLAAAVFSGYEFALFTSGQLFRRTAGQGSFEDDSGTFRPTRCLTFVPGDDRLWGCGQAFNQGHFLATSDGETWEPQLPFLDVVERVCPLGTSGDERCLFGRPPRTDGGVAPNTDGGLSPNPSPSPSPNANDGGGRIRREEPAPPPSGSCQCTAVPKDTPAALAAFFLLVGIASRRRQRGRTD